MIDLLKVAKHGPGDNVCVVRFHYIRPRAGRPAPRWSLSCAVEIWPTKHTGPSVAAEAKTDYTAVKNNLLMRIFWTQHK